jgi:prepilin-type N-terminal cleavage/methylation domain-containing protein
MNKFTLRKTSISLQKGFTLIELLIVITIIATLAVSVFVALNPAQRLKDSKDARRTSDVDTILTAIHAYVVDNGGNYPAGLTSGMVEKQIGTDATAANCALATTYCTIGAAVGCVNLVTPMTKYLKSMPIDPIAGTTYTAAKTGYSVQVDTNGIITVKACGTEGTTLIQSSR